jgi:hypothetical protein
MDVDTRIKLAIYRHFADAASPPTVADIAKSTGAAPDDIRASYARLFARRVLVIEPDGETIRMAPPFSGIETQHRVHIEEKRYFANCAWDALGIPAALHRPALVESRCEQSGEPLSLDVSIAGPEASDWLFHCAVPAAKWWQDIRYT